MKSTRFYSFRNFMDICLKESKIDELVKSQDLIFFFKKGKNIYGGTEENRVMFARMKDKSDKGPPLSLDEKPTFSAINIKRLIDRHAEDDSTSKLEKTFSEEDVDKMKIIDIKEIKEKLSE
jgi:hypothetical protein